MSSLLIDHLNAQLATAWVISFNAKRYHWTVAGPHFRDYHLRFDELHGVVEAMVDELAERVRMLGGIPIHTPAQMAQLSQVAPSDPGRILDALAMAKEALASEDLAIAFMHKGIALAEEAEDPGTADLLTRFVQDHQKKAWFLRAMLS